MQYLSGLLATLFSLTFQNENFQLAPSTLDQTGFQEQDASLILFEPQYPLFTNDLQKRRWIYLPTGAQIDSTDPENFVFPVGTKIWKEFAAQDPAGNKIKIETRYLEKSAQGWSFAAYQWNPEQSQANLVPHRGNPQAYLLPNGRYHSIPMMGQCFACHRGGVEPVLGFTRLQMSAQLDHPRTAGATDLNQLEHQGKFTHPVVDGKIQGDLLTRNALGVLQGNCANCHRPQGFAAQTGFFTEAKFNRAPLDQDVVKTGLDQVSKFKIPGLSTETFRIKAGSPEESAVDFRMHSEVPGQQMPPFGNAMMDTHGAQTVRDWILSL